MLAVPNGTVPNPASTFVSSKCTFQRDPRTPHDKFVTISRSGRPPPQNDLTWAPWCGAPPLPQSSVVVPASEDRTLPSAQREGRCPITLQSKTCTTPLNWESQLLSLKQTPVGGPPLLPDPMFSFKDSTSSLA